MGRTLLTLFYHPDEYHATAVGRELERETFDGSVVVYSYSSSNGRSPDRHLQQKAREQGCSCILTIHSDPTIHPNNYIIFMFSRERKVYLPAFRQLQEKFEAGTYGFVKPTAKPAQIDLELSEQNTTEQSLSIVKELLTLISNL